MQGTAIARSTEYRHAGCMTAPILLFGLSVLLSGCKTLGPISIPADRFNYNMASAQSANEQMLLNILRLRDGNRQQLARFDRSGAREDRAAGEGGRHPQRVPRTRLAGDRTGAVRILDLDGHAPAEDDPEAVRDHALLRDRRPSRDADAVAPQQQPVAVRQGSAQRVFRHFLRSDGWATGALTALGWAVPTRSSAAQPRYSSPR